MGRPRKGSCVEFRDAQNKVRFKIGLTPAPPLKGPQKWWTLPVDTQETKAHNTRDAWNEDSAKNPREYFPELFDDMPQGKAETARQWLGRWEKDRKARGLQTRSSVGVVVKFLGEHADRPIADITRDDLEGRIEWADRCVRDGTIRKWKTAQNAWGLVAKAFDDACNAKTRGLRVRRDNPAQGVRGPDRGEKTGKVYLYPTELLALFACERVPQRWKRIFALATYLYVRPGELEALEWEDVDIERGIVHVHRAIDRDRGGTKATKTDMPRRFPIEPALLPLLDAMKRESGGHGVVVTMPPMEDWARRLRKYVGWAGITRRELTESTPTRKQLTFYDLRATGITWRAVRGDDPLKIMSGAGHKEFRTTQIYIREAEVLRDGFGSVFPPLPPSVTNAEYHASFHASKRQVRGTIASPAGFEPAYQG